jgi:phage shock protein PspC (stress-responsive transcriptional regulator)
MKKIVQTQIGGRTFYMDEDAYVRLQAYLTSLHKYYGHGTEGAEIVADVEARIAEILHDKISVTHRAVSLSDIAAVIATIGEVEQFGDTQTDEEYQHHTQYTNPKTHNMQRRRIFRDTDNRKLGGVCAGLAAYFGLSVSIVRVLFALSGFFYGTSVVIYVLLWAMVPEAKTTSEKIEMRGDKINLENIEKTIKDEFSNFRKNTGL